MKAEEGVQERERERGRTHSLGGKEVKRMERKSTQASVSKRADSINIYPSIYRCASAVPLISFFVGIKEEKGERKEEMRTIYNMGDGGRLTEGI